MNELNFTVLGLRGVGKTTLITSMYEQTVKCLKGTGLNLHADLATSTALSRYLAQLQKVADETKAIVKHGGIAGGASEKEYLFSLGPNGKKADLDIRFTDFPGGWMMDPSKQERVIEIGAKADVLLIPIDSPPLMEKKGRYRPRRPNSRSQTSRRSSINATGLAGSIRAVAFTLRWLITSAGSTSLNSANAGERPTATASGTRVCETVSTPPASTTATRSKPTHVFSTGQTRPGEEPSCGGSPPIVAPSSVGLNETASNTPRSSTTTIPAGLN